MKTILLMMISSLILFSCGNDTATKNDAKVDCPPGVKPDGNLVVTTEISDDMMDYLGSGIIPSEGTKFSINVGYLRYIMANMSDGEDLKFNLVGVRGADVSRRQILMPTTPIADLENTPTLLVYDEKPKPVIVYDIAKRVCPPPPQPACKFSPGDTTVDTRKVQRLDTTIKEQQKQKAK